MGADPGDRRLQPSDVARERRGAFGDLALQRARRQHRGQAAGAFARLKQRPGLLAEILRQRLEDAGARGGVGDKAEVGFPQEDQLRHCGRAAARDCRESRAPAVRQGRSHCPRRRAPPKRPRAWSASRSRKGHARSSCARRSRLARGPCAAKGPQACSTRAHSSRSARNLASVTNSSASAARRKPIAARLRPVRAAPLRAAQKTEPRAERKSQLLAGRSAGRVNWRARRR